MTYQRMAGRLADRFRNSDMEYRTSSSVTKLELRGSDRLEYKEKLYEMVKISYAKIGVPASDASYALKYPLWWLYVNGEGEPIAFNCFKETKYGLKSSLAGSDGSSEGKRVLVDLIRNKFRTNGIYGEVSHSVKEIALAAGAPVVPVEFVAEILGKEIEPADDGKHYFRTITNVGRVKKMMLGKPRGIDIHAASDPSFQSSISDKFSDRDAHLACLLRI